MKSKSKNGSTRVIYVDFEIHEKIFLNDMKIIENIRIDSKNKH